MKITATVVYPVYIEIEVPDPPDGIATMINGELSPRAEWERRVLATLGDNADAALESSSVMPVVDGCSIDDFEGHTIRHINDPFLPVDKHYA